MIGGNFTTLQPNGAPAPLQAEHLAILNADGTIGTSFSEGAVAAAGGQVRVGALLHRGQFLIGGSFAPMGGASAANLFVFFNDAATTEVFALSLPDALPN